MFSPNFLIAVSALWLPAVQFGVAEQQLFPVAGNIFHAQVIPDKLASSVPQMIDKTVITQQFTVCLL